MAVPKKKRYKQIVRTRRSLNKTTLLKKQNINKSHYSSFSFLNSKEEMKYIFSDNTCAYCSNNTSKKVCLNCYTTHFIGAYVKHIKK